MVVFNCNACSAVLKRNQVDKHCSKCRRCDSLSCVDCGKDFWGDDYLQHTKCMTEEEKYCGKDNVPKVFKGEAKQEQWVEKVQAAIENKSMKPQHKKMLQMLKDYSNIPRKKSKFENFVKNSLRVYNPKLVSEIWEILMGDAKTEIGKNAESNDSKSMMVNGKKRKRNDCEEQENPIINKVDEMQEAIGKKKKKKSKKSRDKALNVIGNQKDDDAENENELKNNELEEEEEEEEELPPKKKKKLKFDWERTIKSVLKKKGEMSLKKLRKKILNEFAAQDCANYREENLSAKFDKKILKIEGVKVHKDRASLK